MNSIRLRQTLRVICASAVCALLSSCAWLHSKSSGEQAFRTASIGDALTCDRLEEADSSWEDVTPGPGIVPINFPRSNPVAMLQVPRAAVSASTRFVLKIEKGTTRRALINITAHQGLNNVTTFSKPLQLALYVRSGCKPFKPAPGSTFYIYTMQIDAASGDTMLVEGHGKYVSGGNRVEADLNHLSGYILAQGLLR